MTISNLINHLGPSGVTVLSVLLAADADEWLTVRKIEGRGQLGRNVAYPYLKRLAAMGIVESRLSRRNHRPKEYRLRPDWPRQGSDFPAFARCVRVVRQLERERGATAG
jgi:DNA-binding IclR family transcriptional regulator